MQIESLDNKQIKLLQQLKQKKYRAKEQKFVVEGIHLVALALRNACAEYVFLTENYRVVENVKLYKGNELISNLSCSYAYISAKIADKVADTVTSQGIFALCGMRATMYDGASILLFDGLQDPGNVGTIMRTANAFNIHNFYFTADAVDPYNDKAIRASQGAIFFSNLFFENEQTTFLTNLSELEHVYALDMVGNALNTLKPPKTPFALIVGNEAKGITYKHWGALSIEQINIPMEEEIESLNVAIATGIALYKLQQ